MKRVVIDFDNTFGVQGCDVDDGLALLYLLGNPDLVRVEAACTTYGNNRIDVVHENTLHMLEEWGFKLPVYKGAADADDATESEAARYLAHTCAEDPGQVHILATGSTTNLKQAATVDANFFANAASVTLMGGITESLVINEHIMDELNLSCDPKATLGVLEAAAHGTPVAIATAQNCLPAVFTRNAFEERFGKDGLLTRAVDYWFSSMGRAYDWEAFVCWDVVAAAILAKPELFDETTRDVTLYERALSIGYLEAAAAHAPKARIATPRILDVPAFINDVFDSWQRALKTLGLE